MGCYSVPGAQPVTSSTPVGAYASGKGAGASAEASPLSKRAGHSNSAAAGRPPPERSGPHAPGSPSSLVCSSAARGLAAVRRTRTELPLASLAGVELQEFGVAV